ncbi:MAG: hypothetical protein KIT81_06975 [Alphaproteobacteria bacterium]|nr:hypothetical protein [Alphaproteobacteria bacterium]
MDRARAEVEKIGAQLLEAYAARERDAAAHAAAVDAEIAGDLKAEKQARAAGDLVAQRDRRIAELEAAQRRARDRLALAEASEKAKAEGERQRRLAGLADDVIRKAEAFERAASEAGQAWTALATSASTLASEANLTRLGETLSHHALGGRCSLQLGKAGLGFLAPGMTAWELEHRVDGLAAWLRDQFAIAARPAVSAAGDDGPQAA